MRRGRHGRAWQVRHSQACISHAASHQSRTVSPPQAVPPLCSRCESLGDVVPQLPRALRQERLQVDARVPLREVVEVGQAGVAGGAVGDLAEGLGGRGVRGVRVSGGYGNGAVGALWERWVPWMGCVRAGEMGACARKVRQGCVVSRPRPWDSRVSSEGVAARHALHRRPRLGECLLQCGVGASAALRGVGVQGREGEGLAGAGTLTAQLTLQGCEGGMDGVGQVTSECRCRSNARVDACCSALPPLPPPPPRPSPPAASADCSAIST